MEQAVLAAAGEEARVAHQAEDLRVLASGDAANVEVCLSLPLCGCEHALSSAATLAISELDCSAI